MQIKKTFEEPKIEIEKFLFEAIADESDNLWDEELDERD